MLPKLLAMSGDGNGTRKNPLLQIVNSIMLTIIAVFLGYLTSTLRDIGTQQSDLNIAIAVMNQRYESHIAVAVDTRDHFESRVSSLEKGTVLATADRITKTEALAAIDGLRNWTERYYQRKE